MCGVDWFVLFVDGVCVCEFLLSYAFFSSATHLFRRLFSFLCHCCSFFFVLNFGFCFGKNGGINGSKGALVALRSGVDVLLFALLVICAHGDVPSIPQIEMPNQGQGLLGDALDN